MDALLIVKGIGGFIAVLAHRTIVRAAREEGFGWWMTTMFVPGGSIIYGFVNRDHLGRTLLVKFAGLTIVGAAYIFGIYTAVHEAQALAAEEEEIERYEETNRSTTLAANQAQATPAVIPANLPADVRQRLDVLQERYKKLSDERAQLNVNDVDAVRTFNIRAAEYQAATLSLRAEVAKLSAVNSTAGTKGGTSALPQARPSTLQKP